MMKKILPLFLLVLMSACGGDKSFYVSVNIPSIGTQEITIVYADGSNGERVVLRRPAIDGKFEFTGSSVDTTSVEIFNAKKLLIASFQAVNGLNLELKMDADSIILSDMNIPVVTSFSDSIVSVWPEFPELTLVVQQDSILTVEPYGIWFFTSSTMERQPALLDSIRKYAGNDSVPVRDVYVSTDLSQWRLYSSRDSATWIQGLLPDAPLVLDGILLSTPCIVEVDTVGTVIRVQRLE